MLITSMKLKSITDIMPKRNTIIAENINVDKIIVAIIFKNLIIKYLYISLSPNV